MDRLLVQHGSVRATGSHAHAYPYLVWNAAKVGAAVMGVADTNRNFCTVVVETMKVVVLFSLLVVMAGLAFAQSTTIVTPAPTVLPTAFQTAQQPFASPTASPTPAPKMELPGMPPGMPK